MRIVDAEVAGRVRVAFAVDDAFPDPICAWLADHGTLDEPPLRLALDLLDRGDRSDRSDSSGGRGGVFIDLGAHIGTFSLPAAAIGHPVIAVEGSARNARLLRAAAAHGSFDHLEVVHAAVTASRGEIRFHEEGPWGRVLVDGYEHGGYHDDGDNGGAVVLQGVAVDDLIAERGDPAVTLVKLDLEGGEIDAIAGMSRLLSRQDAPDLLLESHMPGLGERHMQPRHLHEALARYGYRLFAIDRQDEARLVPIEPGDPQPEMVMDLLACRRRPDLPGWHIDTPWERDEIVGRLVTLAASSVWQCRCAAAHTIAEGPAWVRDDPEMVAVLRTLAVDESAAVRAAT